ncbi:hypothetical protein NQD34_018406 [Periophthalmus magnuspinnatus]|nr:hypothetical protein NQD34_018406 [Periophthalmus magnuspinnatus]
MKPLHVWTFAVLMLISDTQGQDPGSNHSVTPTPPERDEPQSLSSTPQHDQNITRDFHQNQTDHSYRPEFENGMSENETVNNSTVEPTNSTTGTNGSSEMVLPPGVSDTETETEEEKEDEYDGNTLPTTETTDVRQTSLLPVTNGGSSWGYIILVLIVLLVLVLCIILFQMRRASRTYTFDLQRPCPSRPNEPIGSFEPVYLDDLDYQVHAAGFSVAVEANARSVD